MREHSAWPGWYWITLQPVTGQPRDFYVVIRRLACQSCMAAAKHIMAAMAIKQPWACAPRLSACLRRAAAVRALICASRHRAEGVLRLARPLRPRRGPARPKVSGRSHALGRVRLHCPAEQGGLPQCWHPGQLVGLLEASDHTGSMSPLGQ
jgi:hypothetical protein